MDEKIKELLDEEIRSQIIDLASFKSGSKERSVGAGRGFERRLRNITKIHREESPDEGSFLFLRIFCIVYYRKL